MSKKSSISKKATDPKKSNRPQKVDNKLSIEARKVDNKGGRPSIEIDFNLLDQLCEIQCTGEECAGILGVDYDTMNTRIHEKYGVGFSEYFGQKGVAGKRSLRRAQFLMATGEYSYADQKWLIYPNPTMAIFLGKNWLGQLDKSAVDVKGKFSFDDLSDDQLDSELKKLTTQTKKR